MGNAARTEAWEQRAASVNVYCVIPAQAGMTRVVMARCSPSRKRERKAKAAAQGKGKARSNTIYNGVI
ncbi:MAG: hypothetical protein K0R10_2588 [Alphaproteobacteria bacterium]|jgi:hypothetical protein|nr:hypothetical protein [Alphaproteobacteria bacterium]